MGAFDNLRDLRTGHFPPCVSLHFNPSALLPPENPIGTSETNCNESHTSSIYVGYPKIAQDAVNDSTLDIKQMVISDPTPDSFHLNQTQVLGSKSSYHPQIYAFDAVVSLAGAAAPFASVTVPGVKSEDGAEIHVQQDVALSDSDAFGDFATAVMLNEEVELNIYGRPGLKEGEFA